VTSAVRALAVGPLAERDVAADPDTESLARVLDDTTAWADGAEVAHPGLLAVLGMRPEPCGAGDVWRDLLQRFPPDDPAGEWTAALEHILREGPLARRLVAAAGEEPDRASLRDVYRALCVCLEDNRPFEGA